MSESLRTWAWKLAVNGVERRRKEVLLHRLRQGNNAVWPGLHCLCSLNNMPLPSKGERINEEIKKEVAVKNWETGTR